LLTSSFAVLTKELSMKIAVAKAIGVFLALLTASATAGEAEEREGLAKLLPGFKSAWNKGELSEVMSFFQSECQLRKAYDADPKKAERQWKELVKEFGEVKSSEIRKYIAGKGCFVVRVTYARKGMVPGTFAIKTDKSGQWRIVDFNIDGQGEPELKE
jgi:hypothetical protein